MSVLLRPPPNGRLAKLYDVQKRMAILVAEMGRRGVTPRPDKHAEWKAKNAGELSVSKANLQARIGERFGIKDFPCTSPAMRALVWREYETPKLKGWSIERPTGRDLKKFLTDTGGLSVKYQALLLLVVQQRIPVEDVPVIEAWWLYQEHEKVRQVLDMSDWTLVGADGRLHPSWNSCGTETGRLTCNEPNLMNLRRDIRSLIGPPPGYAWVHIDKAQLEVRVLAAVAGDDTMQRDLDSGDFYSSMAVRWFGGQMAPGTTAAEVKKKYPDLRQTIKPIHLGRQYGAEVNTIHAQALQEDRRFTRARVQLLVERWNKTYAATVRYHHEEHARVCATGFSETRLLRRRRSYGAPPELTETANYPIQGTAADMMNLEALELRERLKAVNDAHIILQLHDALDVECPLDEVPTVSRIMTECHDREWTIGERRTRFPIDLKVAAYPATWADVA